MKQSRRDFLKASAVSLAALPFIGSVFRMIPTAHAADADLPMAKETDPTPKTLKYCANADGKGKSEGCKLRASKDKAGQYCNNCQFYTKVKGAGKTEAGKCLLIPGNLVAGNAWCNSYTKKQG